MRCVVFTPDGRTGRAWQLALEDLGEDWRCAWAVTAGAALAQEADVLFLADCPESAALLADLQAYPRLAPPWVIGLGWAAPDGRADSPGEAAMLLRQHRAAYRLPALCSVQLPRAEAMAVAFLRMLGVPMRLRAWRFLPRMLAVAVVHPALLADLKHGLYPVIARQQGMALSAVERSLRLWVESAWTHGDLAALDRFFGASVDPEKGKPTNREFLCRAAEHVTLSMNRLMQRS